MSETSLGGWNSANFVPLPNDEDKKKELADPFAIARSDAASQNGGQDWTAWLNSQQKMYEGYQQQQMAANPMGTAPPAPEDPLAQAATEAKNASLSSPYVDPSAQGTLRGGLEAQRQGDSNYSTVLPALAQALPMVALGPVAGAASLGLSGAAEHLNLPGPIQTAAGLAPYFMGGVGDLPTQVASGGGPLGSILTGAAAETLPTALARTAGAGAVGYAGSQLANAGIPGVSDVAGVNVPILGNVGGAVGMALGSAAPEVGGALRTGAENLATSGLTPRPIAPEAVGLRDPATSGMQEILSGNGGGKAPPPGPRDPYNLFDAVGAEKAAGRAADIPPAQGNPLEGLIRAPNEPTISPSDPIAAARSAAEQDAARGYRTNLSLGPDDINNPVVQAYKAQVAGLSPQPPIGEAPPGYIRLYRGESGLPGQAMTLSNGESGQGRWFTSDLKKAEGFGDVSYVDIPEKGSGHYNAGAHSDINIAGEYVLPSELAATKQSLPPQVAGLSVDPPVPPNVQSGQVQPPAQNVQQNVPRPLASNETGSVGGGTYGKATQPDIPPTPGADLADLLSRAKGMAPNDLRAEAIRLGVPIEGRMPPNSLIGRIADAREAALAAAGQRVVDLPALAKKLPGTTLTDLRVGDPRAIAESALQKATDKRDALKANPSPSTQVQLRAASHEVSMVQRAIDTHFPDSPMATAERTPAQGAAPAPGAVAPSVNPSAAPSISEMINSGMTSAEATRTFQDRAAQAGGEAVDRIQADQRAARAEPPYNADGTRSGGGGPIPPAGGRGTTPSSGVPRPPTPAGLDGNIWHNALDLIGAPTRPLLAGLHTARFAPQEVMRPSVLGNGINALGEVLLRGHAKDVIDHVNNDLGPNIPAGLRAADMKAASGNPPVRQTYVSKAINDIPVLGPTLQRLGKSNSTMLGVMRDAHYNTAADRLARTDPLASPAMYKDLWREANNATGHSTIPGLKGSSVAGGMGIGWGALGARVQELGNTIYGSGAPVPFVAAGSRAEAFKTLMGVAATMAGTTALAKALGAQVNLNKPFGSFGLESTFLRPVTSNGLAKTVYGTGGAGYDTLFRAAANIGNDLFNGDESKALDHALAFGRGEFGVVPSAVIDGILGQDWKGDPYSWKDFINEAKTGFMANQEGKFGEGRSVPIAAGENIKAVQAYGPEGLLRALPADLASSAQTSTLNTASQAFKYAAPADIIQKAFPDSPMAQKVLQGKDWSEFLPNEKAQITSVLKTDNPKLADQIHEQSAKQYPASTTHSDTIATLQDRKSQAEDALLDRYNSGKMDLPHLKNAYQVVERDYYAQKTKADSDPSYKKEVDSFKAKGIDPILAQRTVDAYYAIGQHYDDKTTRQAEQAKYIAAVNAKDPELAARLVGAIQPRNQTELEKMYASGALNGVR